MTKVNTTKEFRTAYEQENEAYYKYDDHDVFPTQIMYQDGKIRVNTRVTVTPDTDERVEEIANHVKEVFGDDTDFSVVYDRTEHIENAPQPHTVDYYVVNMA